MEGPINDFSAGYYSINLRAYPDEDGPKIDTHLFDYIEKYLYSNTSAPVWLKAGFQNSTYFRLEEGVHEPMPTDLIGLPSDWMQDLDLDDDNSRRLFYILKPEHAHFVSQSVLLGDTYDERGDSDV